MTTAQEYADEIGAAWRETTEGVLRTATLYNEAKSEGLLNDLNGMVPHSGSTARKLALIGAWWHEIDATTSLRSTSLPPHWGTLYALTRVPIHQLHNLVVSGAVHSGMERAEAEALVPKKTRANGPNVNNVLVAMGLQGNTACAAVSLPVGPATFLDTITNLCALRDAAQPSSYAGDVPRARLAVALAFLTSVHKLAN